MTRDSNNQITVDCADPTPSYVAGKSVKLVDTGGVDTIDIVSIGKELRFPSTSRWTTPLATSPTWTTLPRGSCRSSATLMNEA